MKKIIHYFTRVPFCFPTLQSQRTSNLPRLKQLKPSSVLIRPLRPLKCNINWVGYFLAGYCVLADFDHLLTVQYCNSLDISLGLVSFVCFLEFIKFFIWLSFAFYFEQKQIKPNFFSQYPPKKVQYRRKSLVGDNKKILSTVGFCIWYQPWHLGSQR